MTEDQGLGLKTTGHPKPLSEAPEGVRRLILCDGLSIRSGVQKGMGFTCMHDVTCRSMSNCIALRKGLLKP